MNFHGGQSRHNERGQVLPLFAVSLPIIIFFVGFAIDFGLAYVTKANLTKSVDAACLMGMRNLNQGQAQATVVAQSAFVLNYGSLARDLGPPVVNVNFATDNSNNMVLNVSATATIKTFFIRILPQFKTLNVRANAEATRARLIMSLVLDRSGSMNLNGGAGALPPAVTTFINLFDDNIDRLAMVSFSSNSKVDVPLRTGFKAPITSAANRMVFGGGTFSQSGLLDAQTQNNSVVVAPGENTVKVVVFFTDGWANMNQDSLNCRPTALVNYGGCAPPEAAVGWCSGFSFLNPTTGRRISCGATQFPSQLTGTMQTLNQANISNEAMYRAVQVANAMRAEAVPTVIYSIGLGNKINTAFLYQIANDPASPTFNPNQPIGQAVFAPDCPSATCNSELQEVFQTIASSILLRLSQ